jgi:hypothetical protein
MIGKLVYNHAGFMVEIVRWGYKPTFNFGSLPRCLFGIVVPPGQKNTLWWIIMMYFLFNLLLLSVSRAFRRTKHRMSCALGIETWRTWTRLDCCWRYNPKISQKSLTSYHSYTWMYHSYGDDHIIQKSLTLIWGYHSYTCQHFLVMTTIYGNVDIWE